MGRASLPPITQAMGNPLNERPIMARSLALVFLAVAGAVAAWLAFLHAPHADHVGLASVSAAAAATGAVLLLVPAQRIPDSALKAALALSTVQVSFAIYFSAASDPGFGLFYVWATPYAYFFFSARHAAAQTAWAALCFAVAVGLQPWIPGPVGAELARLEPGRWVVIVCTIVVVGVLVRGLANSRRASDIRMRRGFDDSPLGLAVVSLDLRLLEVNDQYGALVGRSPEEMVGMSVLDMTHPDDRQISHNARAAWLDDGRLRGPIEKRYVRPDGTAVPVRIHSSLMRSESGEPLYFFTQVEDITERTRHEAELARRARQGEAVARLGDVALRTGDLRALVEEAVTVVSATLDVELCSVLELADDGESLGFAAGVGWDEAIAAGATLSLGDAKSPGAYVLECAQPVIVEDFERETRFQPSALLRSRGVRGGLAVVVEGRERPFGVLSAYSRDLRDFSVDDVNFVQAVANVVSTAAERHRSEAATRHAALHDDLTGLPNRRLALDRIEQALRRAGTSGTSVAVLMLDLDHFKLINDSLGHAAGDELLLAIAPRLQEAMRPSDTVARLGGDEFVVVCEGIDGPADAVAVAERIARTVGQPVTLRSGEHRVSASVGIAIAGGDADVPESLLRDADAALYRAKDGGRGRCELFDEPMREQAMHRMRVETELRRALERDELRVHYQPLVELESGRPVGMEALVRWEHPDRGLVGPGEFIAVAEEAGLIGELGEWVLRESCRQGAEWQRETGMALGLSVNVSGRQIAQPAFVAQVAAAMSASGLAAHTLALEITESVLIDGAAAPMTVLADLRDMGLRLMLDDFGTGYSSLSYLQRFRLDGLKIDRSFVQALGRDHEGSTLAEAIVRMAQTLGLGVVAEGVETEEQAQALAALGCTLAQGFLFSKPLSSEDMAAYLRDGAQRAWSASMPTASASATRRSITWPTSPEMSSR
jgi:diguanylate cyclase (GGDEF)-like protein/PAS domain S-box-containing protein